MSEGQGSVTFSFCVCFWHLLSIKTFVHFRIKELKIIYYKSKLSLETHIWLEPWQNYLEKEILQIGVIDTELK